MVVKCLFSWCILALDTGINTVLFNISKTTLISSCLILSCWLIWFNFWHVLDLPNIYLLFIALEMRQVSKQLLLRMAMWLKPLASGSVSIKTPDCSLYWLTIQKGAVTACKGGKERKKKSPSKSGAACIITRSIICFLSSLRSRMVEQEELAAISYLVAMNAVNYQFLSPRI